MRIFLFALAAVMSVLVCVMYVADGNAGVAAIWGCTSGIWIGNMITAIMDA